MMSEVSKIVLLPNVSAPFDDIRRGELGQEFWSARELMSLLGYRNWREFTDAIERAKATARNSGAGDGHFGDALKVIPGGRWGKQTVSDVQLSRYGAYLTTMNGDPRKPEIAAAQTYFAVKTREAELVQSMIPQTYAEALRLAAEQVERAEVAEAKTLELEAKAATDAPKVAAYEQFMDSHGLYSIGAVGKILGIGQNRLFQMLRDKGVLISLGGMKNTPYQEYTHHFKVVASSYQHGDTIGTTRVTKVKPSGLEFIAKKVGKILPDVNDLEPINA
ncbi:MAG: phage antirepressor KilAC domain-containing protein [Mycobacterium sp.]